MKTAVEWLFNQLSINNMALDKCTIAHQEMEQKILEKAKEMEKEQIIMFGAQCMVEVEKESGLGAINIYELTFKQQEQ
jgi:hypothetical protein